jgi:hypothetical protein
MLKIMDITSRFRRIYAIVLFNEIHRKINKSHGTFVKLFGVQKQKFIPKDVYIFKAN